MARIHSYIPESAPMPGGKRSADPATPARSFDLKLFLRLFGFTRAHARTRNLLFVATGLRAIQMPALAWAIGAVIKGPITEGNPPGIALGAAGFIALAAFTQFTMVYRQRLALQLGEAVVHDLREGLFRHMQRMPLSFFHRHKLGRLFSTCTADVDAVRRGIQEVFFVSIVNGGQMLLAALLMAWYDRVLFAVVLVLAPAVYWMSLYFRGRLRRQSQRVQETLSRVYANLAESINGIRVTQGFVRQGVNAGLFRGLAEEHSASNLGVARTTSIYLPLLELNTQLFMAVLMLIGGWRVLDPQTALSLGDLITFFFLANLVFSPLQSLSNQYSVALSAIAGAERVFRLLDTAPEWRDDPAAVELPDPRRSSPAGTPTGARVEFRRVCFGYDPERPVLHDVSFVAESGSMVALVGATGSGKSTITHLVGKMYMPTSGTVLVDEREIGSITGDSLHRQMGFVTQSNFLFTGTILDNIRFGRPEASEAEVLEVCERLACRDLIEALPHGFRTEVGERGASISLGQRQLICFARALIADPRILVLDEATSAIDAITEARLQKALATLLAGRTSIVVAHRLSTIVRADRILVLRDGGLVEQGTHPELLGRNGIYASLYRQFVAGED